MTPYYRIETILYAAAIVLKQVPKARFILVGEGRHRKNLENFSKSIGIGPSVVFTGFIPYDEMPRIIHDADVCIYPVPDSSALAIYEYMACGKPTLIPDYFTEKMGIRADIIPEDCVILAQPSTTAIAKGILSLLEDDLARDRIGRNARAWVENGFSWDQLAVNYESALLSVSRR